jgi:hypothetical protein
MQLNSQILKEFINSKWVYLILFLAVFALINIRQNRITNFNCEICADKAGYYIYLPALFHMGFSASEYPEGFEKEHGDGFVLDRTQNKVISKYAAGVAFLLTPFYLMGTIIARLFSINALPFSYYYLFFINIGAAFYLVTGLFYFRKWIEHYTSRWSSFFTMLFIFFGTNLYYYTLDESLMSHLYSFSMFAIVLYSLKKYSITLEFKYFILFALAFSIAILVRPTNVLFGFIAFSFDIRSFEGFKKKLKLLFQPKNIIAGLLILFLVMLPQFIYWKFAYGNYIAWSYRGEGFTYWNSPMFLAVWFAPQSGLFLWTPIILIPLIYAFVQIKKQQSVFPLITGTFLIVSYILAAWYTPEFGGCNFGKRPMVEYLPVLMMPVGFLLDDFKSSRSISKFLSVLFLLIFTYYNLILFRVFDTCFFGTTWDWNKFLELLQKAISFG